MTVATALMTLDELPAVVARLEAIYRAAEELEEIDYSGVDALAGELDLALEALKTGAPNALLYLEGIRYAQGDRGRFDRWDAGIVGRFNVGELP